MAANKSFTIEQGSDWSLGLTISDKDGPINLVTGYGAVLKVATARGTVGKNVIASSGVILEPSTDGKMSITITAKQSLGVPIQKESVVYPFDIYFIRPGGSKIKILYGTITINAGVI